MCVYVYVFVCMCVCVCVNVDSGGGLCEWEGIQGGTSAWKIIFYNNKKILYQVFIIEGKCLRINLFPIDLSMYAYTV